VNKEGIALVLSGGAARCIAHLGFLQALDEAGIRPAVISGVSGGAIAGAFYCSGFSPTEIVTLIKNTSMLKIFSPGWGTGFLKMDKVEAIFNEHLKNKQFEGLKIPLYITACDVNKAQNFSFFKGDIVKPLIASCSIPPIFKPVEYNGQRLVDGGIIENLPVDPVKGFKKILGINVNVMDYTAPIDTNAMYIERVVDMIVNNNIQSSIEQCSLFLEPPQMKKFHLTDIAKADELFAVGYEYGREKMEEINGLFNQ
jgi:NTE family protein